MTKRPDLTAQVWHQLSPFIPLATMSLACLFGADRLIELRSPWRWALGGIVVAWLMYLPLRPIFEQALPRLSLRSDRPRSLVLSTGHRVVTLTVGFSVLFALLLSDGAIRSAQPIASTDVVSRTLQYLVWNLLDDIPAVAVPATLGWAADAEIPSRGSGAVVLAYEVCIILVVTRRLATIVERRSVRTGTRAELRDSDRRSSVQGRE